VRIKPGSFFYKLFFLFASEYERFDRLIVPNKSLRTGGEEFQDNRYFVQSARLEAERLVANFELTSDSRVLDVGCGYGRLAIGLLDVIGKISYVGIDINHQAIHWCKKYISKEHSDYEFIRLDVYNARYNPGGNIITEDFHFPFTNDQFDVLYLYSVFSHMMPEDIAIYLKELHRVLAKDGHAFFTAFVEESVPYVMVNPKDYRGGNWQSELHCVRYNLEYFNSLLSNSGFAVNKFDYAQETNGQSGFYVSKKTIF
jgi:SAM-dependent methyltransferase